MGQLAVQPEPDDWWSEQEQATDFFKSEAEKISANKQDTAMETEQSFFEIREKALKILREPFPDHQISKLPKPTCKKEEYDKLQKSRCEVCGGWHPKEKTIHLDYVGHAALTDRLLDADPMWYWEPLAMTADGLPKFDDSGGLWIRLTICGHTRLGYGNAKVNPYSDVGSREKEIIGDALRNAAMRFGAALDLWHKGDLHQDDSDNSADKKSTTMITPDPVDPGKVFTAVVWFKETIDADQIEENHTKVKAAWERLSNNERMAVHESLGDKAPDSNRMYRNILKDYLNFHPSEA